MPTAEAAAEAAAGRDLLRVDRYADAAAAFGRALAALDPGGDALERAELVAGLAEARFESGRIEDSEALLLAARAALPAADGSPRTAAACAALELGLARLFGRQRRMAEARALLEGALAALPAAAAPLVAARIEGLLGGVLAVGGDLVPALERLQSARARFQAPALAGHVREAARLAMNVAIALSEFGRHGEAEREIALALDLFDGLVRAGRREALPELARARRNHGFILARQGRQAAAVETLRAAVGAFEQSAQQALADSDRTMWRASAAGTRNSLGYSLFELGEHEEAAAVLRHSLRGFARVLRELPAQQDEQARAQVNLAHVEAARGEFAAAARHYRQGRTTMLRLAATGREALQGDAANAALGLARVALRAGRLRAAGRDFEGALQHYVQATRQGRLQHALAWRAGWQQQMQAWIDAAVAHGPRMVPHGAVLRRVLAPPPLRPAGAGPEPMDALARAAGQVAAWAAQAPTFLGAAFEDTATAWLEHLFDWSATLLAESEPEWLQRHAPAVAAGVAALGDAAAARRDAAALLAGWFFSTRGLRAQRSALAEGSDPRMAALNALLLRLHAIEAEILGEGPAADEAEGAGRRLDPAAWAPAPTPYTERRAAEWRALREQLEPLRAPLLAAGLLPEAPHLDLRRAAGSLAADEALLLLARQAPDRLRVMALHRPVGTAAFAHWREARLDATLAAFPCDLLNRLARAAMTQAARGQPVRAAPVETAADGADDGDAFALECFDHLWRQALAPMVALLQRQGLVRLALVPADDLHLVPWNHLADRHLPAAAPLRVYPSVGAWWRRGRAGPPAAPRWALAASEGTAARPLPWVAVERTLSARLWGGAMQPIAFDAEGRPHDDSAQALLGMGHGGAPDGNPARAGLALGERQVLGAADLARLPACGHALLSACLLGRTEDAQGEGLGFLSACLDWRVGFAAGWLTEVPDYAACLFSLATQWALRASPGQPWSGVLQGLRRTLAGGAWPAGFGAWLAAEGAPLAPGLQGVAAAPPALLLRALPWAVALGD